MSAELTVRSFLEHLARGEHDEAVALLAPDVEWRNTGMPAFRGDRVHQMIRDMGRRGVGFEVEWHHVAESGDVVLTDRTDVIKVGPWSTSFRVRGTFGVTDDRITLWDDAFSWLELLQSSLVGLARMLR
jgi:limonene-1,2-epoxide hydrolase